MTTDPAAELHDFFDRNLTVFPADLDEGDEEEVEVFTTRGELKRLRKSAAMLTALSARVVELEGALEVFGIMAVICDRYYPDRPDDAVFQSGAAWRTKDGKTRTITMGDLRRARTLSSAA